MHNYPINQQLVSLINIRLASAIHSFAAGGTTAVSYQVTREINIELCVLKAALYQDKNGCNTLLLSYLHCCNEL